MRSMPEPSTAIVRPPAASAPRCAAASMPIARPLTTVTPSAASSRPSRSAVESPYALASREPTLAIASRSTGIDGVEHDVPSSSLVDEQLYVHAAVGVRHDHGAQADPLILRNQVRIVRDVVRAIAGKDPAVRQGRVCAAKLLLDDRGA